MRNRKFVAVFVGAMLVGVPGVVLAQDAPKSATKVTVKSSGDGAISEDAVRKALEAARANGGSNDPEAIRAAIMQQLGRSGNSDVKIRVVQGSERGKESGVTKTRTVTKIASDDAAGEKFPELPPVPVPPPNPM